MKWAYKLKGKMTAAVLLFFVLGMILLNNLKEQNNSEEINKVVTSIYNDRLVVESYIFQYSEHLHKIIEIIDSEQYREKEKQERVASIIPQIGVLNEAYAKTHLTTDEAVNFTKFVGLCGSIGSHSNAGDLDSTRQYSKEAVLMLKALSSIQVSEAKMLMTNVNQLFSSVSLSSQFEMVFLIVIAFIIQVLVFASRTLHAGRSQRQPDLN